MKHADQQGTSRRTVLRAGAAAGTAAALGTAGIFAAGTARAATDSGAGAGFPIRPVHPDTSHCTPRVAALFRGFFAAKSKHDTAGMMAYFSRRTPAYLDACLGVALPAGRRSAPSSLDLHETARRRGLLPAAHRRRHAERRDRVHGHPRFLRPGDPGPVLRHLRRQPQDHPLGRLLGRPQLPHPEQHRQHLPRRLQGLRAERGPRRCPGRRSSRRRSGSVRSQVRWEMATACRGTVPARLVTIPCGPSASVREV